MIVYIFTIKNRKTKKKVKIEASYLNEVKSKETWKFLTDWATHIPAFWELIAIEKEVR